LAFDVSNPESPRLTGSLPIPHHENEDLILSTSRKLAVISQQPYRSNPEDTTSELLPGRQFLVDVRDAAAPKGLGYFASPAGASYTTSTSTGSATSP
jgi:hypothetical protein